MYIEDFKRICREVGFTDVRALSSNPIEVTDPVLKDVCGEAKFYSITYRCFKLEGRLETLCEDYGQVAIYKGTMPSAPNAYILDDHHKFETKRPVLVCGNSASMVSETWLGKHFTIIGDRSTHFGLFDCSPAPAAPAAVASSAGGSGGCDPSSGCC